MLGVLTAGLLISAKSSSAQTDVHPRFDLPAPPGSPFPSDRFTVADPEQNTGRRVQLPAPSDCIAQKSDCEDIADLNRLDGFSLTPRVTIPFDGDIQLSSVTIENLFLLPLGPASESCDGDDVLANVRVGAPIALNQFVWDPSSRMLYGTPDEPLKEASRYALIVTTGLRSAGGDPVQPSSEFARYRRDLAGQEFRWYRRALITAEWAARQAGIQHKQLAALSVFTTRSATTLLQKIRDQVFIAPPPRADFNLSPGGARAVDAFDSIQSVTFNRQVSTAPAFTPFTAFDLLMWRFVPGAVGSVAFGHLEVADYMLHPGEYIPAINTRTGVPHVQGKQTLYFNLILPSGVKPPRGWPVAIVGHGRGQHKNFNPDSGTSIVSAHGLAQIQINAVGHGSGPLSTLTITRADGSTVTLPAGGRGFDQNGDGQIGTSEGSEVLPPHALRGNTDAMVQTVADLMHIVRMIQGGVDVDGDGSADLDSSRITYYGHSLGGLYGLMFHALTPPVQASAFLAIASPILENRRLSPASRPLVAAGLGARTSSLLNSAHGLTSIGGLPMAPGPTFNENMPFRNQEPLVNTIPGAIEIQTFLDRSAWITQHGDPLAYAPLLRRAPPVGVAARPFLVQIARGDDMAPLLAFRNILRPGDFQDRVALYRHDLFWPTEPSIFKGSHAFSLALMLIPWRPIVVGAQEQMAAFLASCGLSTPQPNPMEFWEFPIRSELPSQLDYIP
jgi:hypothetical protein